MWTVQVRTLREKREFPETIPTAGIHIKMKSETVFTLLQRKVIEVSDFYGKKQINEIAGCVRLHF